jgi:hypothetical protein
MFVSLYALVGRISHNELSVHGHESFEIQCVYQLPETIISGVQFRKLPRANQAKI